MTTNTSDIEAAKARVSEANDALGSARTAHKNGEDCLYEIAYWANTLEEAQNDLAAAYYKAAQV